MADERFKGQELDEHDEDLQSQKPRSRAPPRRRERMMTAAEAAEMLQVSGRMVRKLAQSGQLPAVRVGRLWRFDPDRLDTFVKGSACETSGSIGAKPKTSDTSAGRAQEIREYEELLGLRKKQKTGK